MGDGYPRRQPAHSGGLENSLGAVCKHQLAVMDSRRRLDRLWSSARYAARVLRLDLSCPSERWHPEAPDCGGCEGLARHESGCLTGRSSHRHHFGRLRAVVLPRTHSRLVCRTPDPRPPRAPVYARGRQGSGVVAGRRAPRLCRVRRGRVRKVRAPRRRPRRITPSTDHQLGARSRGSRMVSRRQLDCIRQEDRPLPGTARRIRADPRGWDESRRHGPGLASANVDQAAAISAARSATTRSSGGGLRR